MYVTCKFSRFYLITFIFYSLVDLKCVFSKFRSAIFRPNSKPNCHFISTIWLNSENMDRTSKIHNFIVCGRGGGRRGGRSGEASNAAFNGGQSSLTASRVDQLKSRRNWSGYGDDYMQRQIGI